MADTKVNGQRTAWADISLDCGYGEVVGVRDISWTESQDKVSRYGKGDRPIGHSRGNWEGSGKIILDHDEFGLFQAFCVKKGKASPLELDPFSISVSYEPAGGNVQTRTLKQCNLSKIDEGAKQGDTELEVTLEFTIHGGVDRG